MKKMETEGEVKMKIKTDLLLSHAASIGLEHADYCVDNQKIAPVDHWDIKKFGLSIDGAYTSVCRGTLSFCVSFFFELNEIRKYVQPVIYYPFPTYRWYWFDKYATTFDRLTWELELICKRDLPLYYCKFAYVSKRYKKIVKKLKKIGIKVVREFPEYALQEFAKEFLQIEDTKEKTRLAENYNIEICKLFLLDYHAIFHEIKRQDERENKDYISKEVSVCLDKLMKEKFTGTLY